MTIAEGELTSMALCWRLERADGAGIGLTSHDERVVSEGIRFEPAPGMMPAAISRNLGLEPDQGEATGALSSDALNEEDLILGRWDDATLQLSAIDWANAGAGPIRLLGGEIGNVAITGDDFTADLRGVAAKLEAPVCPATSAECRANFGDKRCRVDLAGRTVRAMVIAATDRSVTVNIPIDERLVFGRLRFMGGENCGLAFVILAVSGSTVQLRDLPRAPVEPGCRVELREGCDKRFVTCVTRFDNAVNFRGEPHLPGNDLLTRYPGA